MSVRCEGGLHTAHGRSQRAYPSGADALDDGISVAQTNPVLHLFERNCAAEIPFVCNDDDGLVTDLSEFGAKVRELLQRRVERGVGRISNESNHVAPLQELFAAFLTVVLGRNVDDLDVDDFAGVLAVGVGAPVERSGKATILRGGNGCGPELCRQGVGHGRLASKWRTVKHDANRDGLLRR